MGTNPLEELRRQLCGKRIVEVKPSKWSGVVRSLTNNAGYVSITLDDGTVLEAGNLFVREVEHQTQP